MTPIIMLALARLATVEAEEALESGNEDDAIYLLELSERLMGHCPPATGDSCPRVPQSWADKGI